MGGNDYNVNTLGNNMGNCCCSFSMLVILILILLQFGKKKRESSEGTGSGKLVDDGILFIIALFYLSCCNPCKQGMY